LFVGVDVDLGTFLGAPTELDVVPGVGVEDSVDGHFRSPRVLLRGDGEDQLAVLVLDVHALTTALVFAATRDDVGTVLKRLVESQPRHDGEALVLRMLLHDVVPELRPFLEDEELQVFAVNLNGFADNAVDVTGIAVDFQAELTTWDVVVLDLLEGQNSMTDVSLSRNQEFEFASVGRSQLVLLAVDSGPVGVAFAGVSVDLINASAVFVARLFVQQTFVDVDLAVGTSESGIAMAQVFGDQVLAIAVDTRIVRAIVDIRLTMSA